MNPYPGSGLLFERRDQHAVDHLCDTSDLVAAGIGEWIHDWWVYSYPSCYRHCRGPHSNYPGAKAAVGIWII